MDVTVFAVPDLAMQDKLSGATAIVIDALRMTTVAAAAIAGGCARLHAVAEIEEAFALASAHGALLGGERGALPIPGFDFGNSPEEYTHARVARRALVMTTTNGTRAILKAQGAARVLLGAFVNARAVAKAALDADRLCILLAGTNGAFTLEDALAAGAILRQLKSLGAALSLDDMGIAACTLYDGAQGDLHSLLSCTHHYQRLTSLGLKRDLRYCLTEDSLSAVPVQGADGWFEGVKV